MCYGGGLHFVESEIWGWGIGVLWMEDPWLEQLGKVEDGESSREKSHFYLCSFGLDNSCNITTVVVFHVYILPPLYQFNWRIFSHKIINMAL